jgi:hypothetical protein
VSGLEIDPRMAERLRQTFKTRLGQFEAEAAHRVSDLVDFCRRLGATGHVEFHRIADGLETFQELMQKHPAHTPEGKDIRDRFAIAIADLQQRFSELADLADIAQRDS